MGRETAEMKQKIFKLRLTKGGPPFWFPGYTLQHAIAKAKEAFDYYAMDTDELTGREYFIRKKRIPTKKLRRRKAKQIISVH